MIFIHSQYSPFLIIHGIAPYHDLICLLVSVLVDLQRAPKLNVHAPEV